MPDGAIRSCGSCGFRSLIPVLDMGDQPLPNPRPGGDDGRRYPLQLVKCTRCMLVQLGYIVPQRDLFPADYPYVTGNTRALREHFTRQARTITAMTAPGDLVTDIGGNDGTMLAALAGMAPGLRLLLIEPSDQIRKGPPGIGAVQDYFTTGLAARIREEHGPARVITASNVFGHVPDPHDFLNGVMLLLDGNGTLIIENQDWYNVVNLLQIDTIYHEHLRYYTPASLSYLLEQHGLLVTSLTRTGMHGGAFRAMAVREKGSLSQRAGVLMITLRKLLEDASQDGPVYAIAAPTRATSLVNYTGIGSYLACACEIAGSEKIGLTIPGTGVPIVDEEKLFADQPPNALLLAWDLADSIIPAVRRRGYKGRILVPLPEPGYADG